MSNEPFQAIARLNRLKFEERRRGKKVSPNTGLSRQEVEARDRERNRVNQAARRARLKADDGAAAEIDQLMEHLDVEPDVQPYTTARARADIEAFRAWLTISGPRQRQLRRRAREIGARHIVIAEWRAKHGDANPTPTELGRVLNITRAKAQTALRLDADLEAAGAWGEGHTAMIR
jgi:hypothetical protein